jgi:hypothetical protein
MYELSNTSEEEHLIISLKHGMDEDTVSMPSSKYSKPSFGTSCPTNRPLAVAHQKIYNAILNHATRLPLHHQRCEFGPP